MPNHQPLTPNLPVDVERLKSFSDNIYAFSMTLLITGIHLPELAPENVAFRFLGTLIHEWRQFAIYAISFLNIGSYWLLHHSIYAYINRLDKRLIWLNLLLLLTVTFLPLPTALMGKYGRDPVTALVYGITIAINYIVLCLIVRYVYRNKNLARTDIHLPIKQVVLFRFGLPLILVIMGTLLSFVYTKLSFLLYLCVALVNTVPWQSVFKEVDNVE
jgi:uncharacterized membrane protein